MSFMYLYPCNTVRFDNNGKGPLSDAISASSSEELNEIPEIEFMYPANGLQEIKMGDIVVARPRKNAGEHPFVIDKIERPFDGVLSVHASHWSVLLSGVVVDSIEGTTAAEVIRKMHTAKTADPPGGIITEQWTEFYNRQHNDGAFPMPTDYIRMYNASTQEAYTDVDTDEEGETIHRSFKTEGPTSFRALMGDEIEGGSLLNVFKGEYKYEPIVGNQAGTKIRLLKQRGKMTDVVIQYGFNMTDFQLDEDWTDVYTSLIPFFKKDSTYIMGSVVSSTKTFPFTKFMMLDVTGEFQNGTPDVEAITAAGQKYFDENKIDEPDLDLTVKTDVFEDIDVDVGDYITVCFPMYNYDAVLECKKITGDILNDVITEFEFMTVKKNVDTIVAQSAVATGGNISKSKQATSPKVASSGGGGGGGGTIYPSNAMPKMDGRDPDSSESDSPDQPGPGTSTLYARGDHRHPSNARKLNIGNTITNRDIEDILNS